MCDTVVNDKLFYVFGTGAHSIMSAMELFVRAGNLCNAFCGNRVSSTGTR